MTSQIPRDKTASRSWFITAGSGWEITNVWSKYEVYIQNLIHTVQAKVFKLGCILSSIMHCALDRLFPFSQPSRKIKESMKNNNVQYYDRHQYHANIMFLSQINLMHRPLSHISIRGFSGSQIKTILQSSSLM